MLCIRWLHTAGASDVKRRVWCIHLLRWRQQHMRRATCSGGARLVWQPGLVCCGAHLMLAVTRLLSRSHSLSSPSPSLQHNAQDIRCLAYDVNKCAAQQWWASAAQAVQVLLLSELYCLPCSQSTASRQKGDTLHCCSVSPQNIQRLWRRWGRHTAAAAAAATGGMQMFTYPVC